MLSRYAIVLVLAVVSVAARADSLAFEDAWIRATPPGVATAAGYITIANDGAPDRLLAVRSDAARQVEIHTTVAQDGLMKMVRLEALAISTGQPTKLEPGKDHIMFIGIRRPFAPGETVPVTLVFEKAGALEIEFPVRDARVADR